MATGTAIFVGWGRTHPGREPRALEHYREFVAVLEELKKEGAIESFETTLLGPHGGELDGFTLIHGAPEKLALLPLREEMHRLQAKAHLDHGKLSVIWAVTGGAVDREYELMADAVEEYQLV